MTALTIIAGILLYAAGFVAALWPFVLLIVAFITPWVGLYRITTRDRRARKHTEAA
ncbi:hypothetical protein [Streptosporangium sp. OZ121]|uniref:hypothetical protein n=1 Tax=Streptosporangium sp. OZ121 TaxID=3444183 RepID=UPI003F796FBA